MSRDCLTIEEKQYTGNKGSPINVECDYDPAYKEYVKYWCKGYYRASCTILRYTSQTPDGEIMINDQATDGKMTVTMEKLRSEDTGWYWCGIERSHLLDIMDYTYLTVADHAPEKNMNNDEFTWLYYILTPLFGFVLLLFVVAVISRRTMRKNKALDECEGISGSEQS
ncbi:transmembrane domain-containing protein TMIGD3-like [Lissotriton helveticus]